ncbi:MAG TPA: tRNA 2-thiouridine(34) synthase MnmA [Thermomicrobiales bacterium]|nr:tRNA 2-thiouridine(34) synthase MnmA [Thermomicrobiales bacterium]
MPTTTRVNPIIPLIPSQSPLVIPGAGGASCPARQLPTSLPRLSTEDARALLSRYDTGPIDGSGQTIVVAMSGGVDSAVAALVLRERGYRVVGVNMRLYNPPDEQGFINPCCSIDAMEDARATCQRIDVPFYAMNMAKEFEAGVIDRFVSEYAAGRTPNPCLECNRHVKFRHLIGKARMLGANGLATGHYARIERDDAGVYHLFRAVDDQKDQSYVLHTLDQEQLAYLQFPLGRLRKTEVRELARGFGLPVADKPESQDLCFVASGEHAGFVARRLGDEAGRMTTPGPIVDGAGNVVGQHRGLLHYTVGQRKGLGVSAREPLFVLRLDPRQNLLIVGPRSELATSRIVADGVSFTDDRWPDAPFDCQIVVRYRGTAYPATVEPGLPGAVIVRATGLSGAVAPGQAIVFYKGDEALGGGTIRATDAPGLSVAS